MSPVNWTSICPSEQFAGADEVAAFGKTGCSVGKILIIPEVAVRSGHKLSVTVKV